MKVLLNYKVVQNLNTNNQVIKYDNARAKNCCNFYVELSDIFNSCINSYEKILKSKVVKKNL